MDKETSDESSTDLDELKNADWVRHQLSTDSASSVIYRSSQCLPKIAYFILKSLLIEIKSPQFQFPLHHLFFQLSTHCYCSKIRGKCTWQGEQKCVIY